MLKTSILGSVTIWDMEIIVNQLLDSPYNFLVTLRPNRRAFIRLRRVLWIGLVMWHATRKLLQYQVPGVWEQETEAPFLVKWWLFDTFPDRFLYPSLKPLFFFVQNDNVFTVELVAWVFGVGKDSRVLIFVGTASSVLIETCLYGLFSLSHIWFITTSVGTFKPPKFSHRW